MCIVCIDVSHKKYVVHSHNSRPANHAEDRGKHSQAGQASCGSTKGSAHFVGTLAKNMTQDSHYRGLRK